MNRRSETLAEQQMSGTLKTSDPFEQGLMK